MKRLACTCALGLALAACGGAIAEKPVIAGPQPADPRAAHSYLEGIKWLAQKGRDNETHAIESFEAALAIDPGLWEAHYNLGVVYERRGEARKALQHFEAAHQTEPSASEPLIGLAEAQHRLGDRAAASDLLEQYLQSHADDNKVRVLLTSILRERGRFDDALTQARDALVRDPANAAALLEVGRIYRAKQEPDVAELVFRKVLALDPKSAPAHNDLGLLGLERGDTQLAFDEFEKAVAVDPSFAPARMNRASVLVHAGDYAAAHAEYEKVLALDEHAVDARVGLGVSLRGLGKHADAEKAYEKALEDAPSDPAALFDLGVLRAEFLNRRGEARELFERYLDVAASDAVERPVAERYLAQIPAAPAPAVAPAPKPAAAPTHAKPVKKKTGS